MLNDIKVHVDVAKLSTAFPNWSKKRFPYPHHRLYYAVGGEATLILNNSEHILKPGYIYLLPAFSMVETICKDYFTHYYIHFQLRNLDVLDLFTIYEPVIELKASETAKELFNTIMDHYEKSTPYSSMMTISAMYQLIAPFFKDCLRPNEELLRFEPVLNYIDYNLETKITNEQMAKIMDLDPVYFNNLFSKTFSMPPTQYLIKKRLEIAQTLLLGTNLKINEIATRSGFDNNMYFSRIFKQKVGMTPSNYRAYNQ